MDVAEQKPYDDSLVAVNGEEQVHEENTEEHGIDYVDSAGNDLKRSVDDHRDSSAGKLFVGGISWQSTEESFASYFSKYGEIIDSVIMMDKHTGRPRGFGFVTFADPAVADKVLEEEHIIDGRTVEVKRTVPKEDSQVKGVSKTRKIFIGGIPPSFTEDELKVHFSHYGSIVDHQIMLDSKTGRSRGFGFVTFESEESVESIFSEGKTHELGGKEVEIKRAEPKRASSDYANGSRPRYGGGSAAKSYGGGAAKSYGGSYGSADGGYSGKMGRGYGGYGGFDSYGGDYGGGSAGLYNGYGGGEYGYGYGFGGPMYGGGAGYGGGGAGYGGGGAGYGGRGAGYGGGGYSMPGGYGGATGYGGGAAGYGVGKGGGGGGGYGGTKGYARGGSASERYHPYGR